MDDRDRDRWRDCLEVIERLCKGRPIGIPPADIVPGLYVLDWLPGRSDRFDGVKLERVIAVEGDVVEMIDSTTTLDCFAALVVAGPFPD